MHEGSRRMKCEVHERASVKRVIHEVTRSSTTSNHSSRLQASCFAASRDLRGFVIHLPRARNKHVLQRWRNAINAAHLYAGFDEDLLDQRPVCLRILGDDVDERAVERDLLENAETAQRRDGEVRPVAGNGRLAWTRGALAPSTMTPAPWATAMVRVRAARHRMVRAVGGMTR